MAHQLTIQIITSFISSAAFSCLFNTPRKYLIASGISGMIGWVVYILMTWRGIDAVPASLVAAFCIAMIGPWFARRYKAPVIIFNASGIIPLVPGGLAYSAILNFVRNHYDIAIQAAAKVSLISGAIALGLLFSEVVYRSGRQLGARKRAGV